MTTKRFELCDVDLYEYGMPLNEIIDNGVPLSQNQVCELLNELHEENENLKDVNVQCCNDYSAMRRDVLRYKKENEQLKKDCTALIYHNQEYRKENEQLKEEKEKWKSNCSLTDSENSILWNEISILREQGAEPSEAFNDYLNKKRGDLND